MAFASKVERVVLNALENEFGSGGQAATAYGRGAGVGRDLGVTLGLAVGVGLGVIVGVAVAVAVGVAVGVDEAVAVALGVGVISGLSVDHLDRRLLGKVRETIPCTRCIWPGCRFPGPCYGIRSIARRAPCQSDHPRRRRQSQSL
jgi:hypothetical protein